MLRMLGSDDLRRTAVTTPSFKALSLSAGAAAFTHSSQGLGVATIIILGMTMPGPWLSQASGKLSTDMSIESIPCKNFRLSAYTFHMVAESSAVAGRKLWKQNRVADLPAKRI